MTLGERIRFFRKSKKITLVSLSELTGIAQATLSRIETGIMAGTVESHSNIALALGMTLADLYDDRQNRLESIEVLKASPRDEASYNPDGIIRQILVQNVAKKKMTPLLISLGAGKQTAHECKENGTQIFLYCIEGSFALNLEEKSYRLVAGESIYFDASLSYNFSNETDTDARFLMVMTPASV